MTEPEAKRLFEKWRDRLHLEAWDLRFEWKVRQRDMYVEERLIEKHGGIVSTTEWRCL